MEAGDEAALWSALQQGLRPPWPHPQPQPWPESQQPGCQPESQLEPPPFLVGLSSSGTVAAVAVDVAVTIPASPSSEAHSNTKAHAGAAFVVETSRRHRRSPGCQHAGVSADAIIRTRSVVPGAGSCTVHVAAAIGRVQCTDADLVCAPAACLSRCAVEPEKGAQWTWGHALVQCRGTRESIWGWEYCFSWSPADLPRLAVTLFLRISRACYLSLLERPAFGPLSPVD